MTDTPERRIAEALDVAVQYGGIDGEHHKTWVIDQMVRALTGCPMVQASAIDAHGKRYTCDTRGESDEYTRLVIDAKSGEDGPETYDWNVGITGNNILGSPGHGGVALGAWPRCYGLGWPTTSFCRSRQSWQWSAWCFGGFSETTSGRFLRSSGGGAP